MPKLDPRPGEGVWMPGIIVATLPGGVLHVRMDNGMTIRTHRNALQLTDEIHTPEWDAWARSKFGTTNIDFIVQILERRVDDALSKTKRRRWWHTLLAIDP